jgi:hypothetical protein
MMWIVVLAALIGVVLNIYKKAVCFVIWFFTSSIWCIYDFAIGAYEQSALFAVYTLLAIWGIIQWRKKPKYPSKPT